MKPQASAAVRIMARDCEIENLRAENAELRAACEAALHLINAHDDGDERTVEELLNQICAALDKARGGG
jgi:hypothetical protein